ncbi:MAG: asparagine synthetase B, partial [Bacteroidetes bacterium]|nr:asparagine synthetase B [Bacteroidota bacterium]
MSGIFGLHNFYNPSIHTSTLDLFLENMRHRGPDGHDVWVDHFIGLGQCMLHTTEESLSEQLPFFESVSGIAITADARIDNRDELAEMLGISKSQSREMADSQLILAAFNKCGTDSFVKLIGDFAFVLWDSRNQRLYCVRDAIGIKPFYYRKTKEAFYFSSEIKPLALLEGSLPPVNEGMVAEYLAFQFATRDETLFQDIYRLPPAHYIVVEKNKLKIQKYWDISFPNRLHYKKDEEYGEHFYEIFKKSVSCRMRSHREIGIELSGGLDSSSIVSMASSLKGSNSKRNFQTYSLVFPNLPCDEREYIDSVTKKWDVKATYIHAHNFQTPQWQKQVLESFHLPNMPNLSMTDHLVKTVQESGKKVILSGIGGDEWFSGSGANFIDLMKNGLWGDFAKEIAFQNRYGRKALLKKFALHLSWPVSHRILKSSYCSNQIKSSFPSWLTNTIINKTNLLKRIKKTDARLYFNNLITAFYYK